MKELYRIKIFYRDMIKVIDNTKIGIKSIIKTITKEYMLTVENHVIITKHVTDFKLFKLKFMDESAPDYSNVSNEIEIPLTREEIEELFKNIKEFNIYRGEE